MEFTTGQKLEARSIGDHNCIFTGTVISRTAKTVTLETCQDGVVRRKIQHDQDGNEYCYPYGQYSMAPTFKA